MIRKRVKDFAKRLYFVMRTVGLYALFPLLKWRPAGDIKTARINKILVVRLDRIGDMVLTLPIFSAIKRQWPSASLALLCRDYAEPVVRGNQSIDRIIVMQSPVKGRVPGMNWWPGLTSLIKELRQEGFDLVIDAYNGRDLDTAYIAWKTHAPYRAGFAIAGRGIFFTHTVPLCMSTPFLSQQQSLLAKLGGHKPLESPRLMVTERERHDAAERLHNSGLDLSLPIVGIHPGGYYPTQRWPLGRFLALAHALNEEQQLQVAFFGTREEERLIAQIGMPSHSRFAVFFGLELRELISIMSWCRLFVCNHSGPLHIAGALGLRTVSTMGPHEPTMWWPVGKGQLVLRKALWCSPCMEGLCPIGTHECLMAISVDEMLAAIRRQMVGEEWGRIPATLVNTMDDGVMR